MKTKCSLLIYNKAIGYVGFKSKNSYVASKLLYKMYILHFCNLLIIL